ncbi:MAG: SDR family oxidoreductase [Phycisphaerae bacterium]
MGVGFTATDSVAHNAARRVCLTGATGYVGGRLGARLLAAGFRICCISRSSRKLQSRHWAQSPLVEIVEADISDVDTIVPKLAGCEAAYYLVHSMEAAGADYARRDREIATAFSRACAQAGVGRIIYLGGLGETGDALSEHLASRREVEECLAAGGVPVTVLRAAMIIGSGSASYEILRYLTERLPVMITPRWVKTQCQPIAIRDVLRYLVQCLNVPDTIGKTFDIGGPEIVTYKQLINLMARAQSLRRRIIVPVPLLTPRLSSLWIHLVTPLSYRVARPLADGLKNRVVCRDSRSTELMPGPPLTPAEAIALAAGKVDSDDVETSWSDAGVIPGDPDWAGGHVFKDVRTVEVSATAAATFQAACRVGGGHGYYAADWLWHIRGWMDRLVGGPGLRRKRRSSSQLSFGDALDFWRVTEIRENERLRLRAEMKLPGDAQLEFEIKPALGIANKCILVQTARFRPSGLFGLLYWYAVLPLHGYVFRRMLGGIRREAEMQGRKKGQ